MLCGKKLSILGDSISTYKDVSDNPSYNSRLFYNPFFYRDPFPMEGTYWHRLMERFGLELCVNNSWSGGNLSGQDNEDSGVNRAEYLADNDGKKPDIIIVFMGINDLGRRVKAEVFSADYKRTLEIIKEKYPCAMVCCVNIPDRDIVLKRQAEIFNSAIAKAVEEMGNGFFIADLFGSRLNNDFYYMNTVDGLHPSESGMEIISEIIGEALANQIKKGI